MEYKCISKTVLFCKLWKLKDILKPITFTLKNEKDDREQSLEGNSIGFNGIWGCADPLISQICRLLSIYKLTHCWFLICRFHCIIPHKDTMIVKA